MTANTVGLDLVSQSHALPEASRRHLHTMDKSFRKVGLNVQHLNGLESLLNGHEIWRKKRAHLFSSQELQLWEQTACNKHLNQSLWEFCYWLWSRKDWGLYYGSCDSVCGFLMAKISHGQLESKDFIFGLKKKGMKENSILLCSLAFILKGI